MPGDEERKLRSQQLRLLLVVLPWLLVAGAGLAAVDVALGKPLLGVIWGVALLVLMAVATAVILASSRR